MAESLRHAAAVAEDGVAEWLQEAALQLPELNITMLWYNASDEQGPPGEPCVHACVLPMLGSCWGVVRGVASSGSHAMLRLWQRQA